MSAGYFIRIPLHDVNNYMCLLYVSSPSPLPRMSTPKFVYYMCRARALTRALEFGSRPPGTRVERNDARIRRGAQALRRVRGAVSNIYRRGCGPRAWWRQGAISGMRIGLLQRLLFKYSTSLLTPPISEGSYLASNGASGIQHKPGGYPYCSAQ